MTRPLHAPPATDVPLAPLTSLELGGPARFFLEAADETAVLEALAWARCEDVPAVVLGGGSNVVVADAGFDGLVIRLVGRGVGRARDGGDVLVTAAAGEPWDDLVAGTVADGLAGLECLSGIPGTAGAAPVQNVGAYGQDVSETVARVRAVDRARLAPEELRGDACGFVYRGSTFRAAPERWALVSVTFRLRPDGAGAVRYPELARHLGAGTAAPRPAEVREAVLELRRSKSMVLEPDDPNRRSAGSFFLNPVLPAAEAEAVARRAAASGAAADPSEVPRFPAGSGLVKLSAAWLIERAGFARGLRRGAVGISSRHALALVHHGGGTTAALLALAGEIRLVVHRRYGVVLVPEPAFIGFGAADPLGREAALPAP